MICRHLVTNLAAGCCRTGTCYTLAFRAQAADNPGRLDHAHLPCPLNHDRFTRHPMRGWLFARREVVADLVGPDQMRALLLTARAAPA
jgi:hypothetical protein